MECYENAAGDVVYPDRDGWGAGIVEVTISELMLFFFLKDLVMYLFYRERECEHKHEEQQAE